MQVDDAITKCQARRPIVDPHISASLIDLLSRLHAAHSGVAPLPRAALATR